jgi:hypothetical protein
VADLYRNNALPWLERELARQMAPVRAPESLWDGISRQQRRRPYRSPFEWVFWPAAAAMVAAMLLLAFAGILRSSGARHDPDRLTEQELAVLAGGSRGIPQGFDFHSENLEETRAWVKAEANIDIDLPAGRPGADRCAVRLLGARLIQFRGRPVAAVDYRIGDEVATLFVSGKRAGVVGNSEASEHLFSRMESAADAPLISWNTRNQTYMIAFSGAENPHGACLLCHLN